MTSRGPSHPSTPPQGTPPGAPPHPTDRTPPGRARRRVLPVLALVVGLVVGAGIVGGIWWATGEDAGAVPTPIPISLESLPDEVLGQQRDDLALRALDEEKAKKNGAEQATLYTDAIDAYQQAYGGPGIKASYGTVAGGAIYQLLIVNGIQPAPLVTPDSVLDQARYVTSIHGVATTGTATTVCVTSPTARGVIIDDDTTVDAAQQQVLQDPESSVTCVRSDRGRNLSVQIVSRGDETAAPPSTRGKEIAAEVDRIWQSLIGE